VFNLIVGAGALTIPAAFANVGILLGTTFLIFLSILGYVSATFVVEAMACSNALLAERSGSESKQLEAIRSTITAGSDDEEEDNEDASLVSKKTDEALLGKFDIVQKVEMSQMASLFLGPTGTLLFYTAIIAYLYGDLAIYAVAVPKSLRDLVCPLPSDLTAQTAEAWECVRPPYADGDALATGHMRPVTPAVGKWLGELTGWTLDSQQMYHTFCVIFTFTIAPSAFFSITNSKWLQLVTTVCRHVAFFLYSHCTHILYSPYCTHTLYGVQARSLLSDDSGGGIRYIQWGGGGPHYTDDAYGRDPAAHYVRYGDRLYCTHTVRILYSYCTHTVRILYSYCTHTLYSYSTHTALQVWPSTPSCATTPSPP
jgi:hypothetical protein